MAQSTGIMLAAGAFPFAEMVVVSGWQPERGLRIIAGTILAAFVSAGLDKVAPGLGTGLAALVLVGSLFKYGPPLAESVKSLG